MKNSKSLKTLAAVRREHQSEDARSYSALFTMVNKKLIENGFSENLDLLDGVLAENPFFYDACNRIHSKLQKHRCVFVLCNSGDIMWKLHAYFPVIYAINNLGKSVYRVTVKKLIDSLLSRDDYGKKLEFKQSLSMFTGILYPDPRLNSMSPSVEYLLENVICNNNPSKKILFTAYNYFGNRENAINDSTHKLRTYYSPKLEDIFKRNVDLLYINTPSEVRSSWLVGGDDDDE